MKSDDNPIRQDMTAEAIISPCGNYRYLLSRSWDAGKPAVLFICLNPSTADAMADDPTVRVCVNYAKRWGYGRLLIGNLFAIRATNPRMLWHVSDPIGPENDHYLQQLQSAVALVICAWGNLGALQNRDRQVLPMLHTPHCLSILSSGQPGHPLYKKATLQPIIYTRLDQ